MELNLSHQILLWEITLWQEINKNLTFSQKNPTEPLWGRATVQYFSIWSSWEKCPKSVWNCCREILDSSPPTLHCWSTVWSPWGVFLGYPSQVIPCSQAANPAQCFSKEGLRSQLSAAWGDNAEPALSPSLRVITTEWIIQKEHFASDKWCFGDSLGWPSFWTILIHTPELHILTLQCLGERLPSQLGIDRDCLGKAEKSGEKEMILEKGKWGSRRKGKDKERSTKCREGHLRGAGIEVKGKGSFFEDSSQSESQWVMENKPEFREPAAILQWTKVVVNLGFFCDYPVSSRHFFAF